MEPDDQPAFDQPAVGARPEVEQPVVEDPDSGELAVLADIEADLVAVEEAMSGLDRIDSSEIGGAAAAAQVAAIVGSERFDVTS